MEKSTSTFLDRTNTGVASLIRRFENLIALAQQSPETAKAAYESYQVEVETLALVSAAEELTALTRQLKETWLFGRLDVLGANEADARTEKHARAIAEHLGLNADQGQPKIKQESPSDK